MARPAQYAPPSTSAKAHLLAHLRPDEAKQPEHLAGLSGLDLCSAETFPSLFPHVDRIFRLRRLLRSLRGRVGDLPAFPRIRVGVHVAALHGGVGFHLPGRAPLSVTGGRPGQRLRGRPQHQHGRHPDVCRSAGHEDHGGSRRCSPTTGICTGGGTNGGVCAGD